MVKQVNLLPESKQARQRAARSRKLAITIATIIMAIAIAIPILLLTIKGSQLLLLNRTQAKIDEHKATLKNTQDMSTMLTAKDHLASLPTLYIQRFEVTELLSYLPALIPNNVRLSSLEIDTTGNLKITGISSNYASVEKFYHALLIDKEPFNAQRVENDPQTSGLFASVVLDEVSGPSGGDVSFTIRASLSPEIIDGERSG